MANKCFDVSDPLNNDFSKLIVGGKPVLTFYNGNADVLKASVSMSLMELGINIPSCICGMGFDIGTTGDMKSLLKKYNLDSIGISKKSKSFDFIKSSSFRGGLYRLPFFYIFFKRIYYYE